MINNISRGIRAYFGAFKLISKLKLWKYFSIPVLISLIVAIIIIIAAINLSDDIGLYISNIWKWEFGKSTFNAIATFISGLLILVVGVMLYKHIVMALSSPFMSPVSEKIEYHLTGKTLTHRETSFKEQLMRGIKISLRNLSREILFTIPILILGLIPIVGLISPFFLFLIQAYYAGFGNMDYTLERHFKYKDSITFVQENRGLAIGNGLVFILFLLVPVIGIILVLPFSVTAATTETIKQIELKKLQQ